MLNYYLQLVRKYSTISTTNCKSTPVSKYTVKQFRKDFPDDEACVVWLKEYLYPDGIKCKSCKRITGHSLVKGRRAYVCHKCGRHEHILVGTIFDHSHVPLTDWFHAIYLMSSNKAGTSAKELERQLGVSYRVAWRMMHQIRGMMNMQDEELGNEVEIDEAYVHANVYKRSSARNRYGPTGRRAGEILFGIVERGGKVKIWHVRSSGVRVLQPIIKRNVPRGAIIHSDGHRSYKTLPKAGYNHKTTNHSIGQYVSPDSYTQNIENVWSHLKRGFKGVYRHVEPKYLQLYANEFAWRYSYRKEPTLFWQLLKDASLRASS